LSKAENRESLIVQCLPLLVLNASDEKIDAFTTKTHIQRLYKLRDAFGCIDFADPSSDSLRALLLRVASNPVCLQMPEGRKFLAGLLQQDVHLVKDLHKAFRVQIPEAKPSILKSYGEIYHRAWKEVRQNEDDDTITESEEEQEEIVSIREAIEHEVLQDLMYSVVHMDSPTTFQSILTVLEPLHADKKNNEVASLLYRLYSPIMWRSLAATNSRIRKNSVVVLEKVFPLHDPFNSLSMKDSVLKATDAMQVALQDVDPSVRVAASGATARTCAIFWEILPPKEIRSLLNRELEFGLGSSFELLFDTVQNSPFALSSQILLFSTRQIQGQLPYVLLR
jgi:condensin-2 complex subunit G2